MSRSPPTRLEQTWLSKRVWSFVLFFGLILFGLVTPLVSLWDAERLEMLRKSPLPSDHLWLSGPLSGAHLTLEIQHNCNVCHQRLFQPVNNQQCVQCHQSMSGHVDQNQFQAPDLIDPRCSSCHKEHNEPSTLVRHDQQLCVDCHRDLASRIAQHQIPFAGRVSQFNADGHPEFRIALLTPKIEAHRVEWSILRREIIDAGLNDNAVAQKPEEDSHLKFSHQIHLDADKVQSLVSDHGLECNDCHRLQHDEEHFEPISMEKDCRSCHQLNFDESEPERELPHGSLADAILSLKEHFIRKFAEPVTANVSVAPTRRIPTRPELDRRCLEDVYRCGVAMAEIEAGDQFSKAGCITCHDVSENPDAELDDRWWIKPVKLNADWYPKARFDHASHLTQSGQQGSDACMSCHAAQSSTHSQDILIPAKQNCLQCHNDDLGNVNVRLDCVGCHRFHLKGMPLMSDAAGET